VFDTACGSAESDLAGSDLAGLDLADALRAACEAELPGPRCRPSSAWCRSYPSARRARCPGAGCGN